MDLFKPAFKLLLFLIVIAVIGFFGFREYLVLKSFNLINNDYKELYRNFTVSSQSRSCIDQFGTQSQQLGPDIYQLRFIDKHTYVTEVLCNSLTSQAITIKTVSLPSFVSRNPVGTGFIANHKDVMEMVGFDVFGEAKTDWQKQILEKLPFLKKSFYLVKHQYQLKKQTGVSSTQVVSDSSGPKTTCLGSGYTCCNPVTSLGKGQSKTDVFDCVDNCYVTCQSRPVILAFNASGDFDPYLRQVNITSGSQSISFVVVVDSQKMNIDGVEVNFGDGQSAKLSGDGPFEVSHTYVCNQTQCHYLAKAVATTETGVSSYESSISKIKVVVNR